MNIRTNLNTFGEVSRSMKQLIMELEILKNDLAAVTNGKGASMVGIEDADGKFACTNVEEALRVLRDNIEDHVGAWDDAVD